MKFKSYYKLPCILFRKYNVDVIWPLVEYPAEKYEEKAIYETIYKWTCVELPIVYVLES